MRVSLLAAVLGVLLCGAALATEYTSPFFRVLQVKTTVDFQEQTFDEFVTWMREYVGWNVIVDWDSLAAQEVDRDTLITIRMQEAPVRVIVNEVLRQVSTGITYHLTENLMTISSRDNFNKDVYTRAYDLNDLILSTSSEDIPAVDLKSMSTKEPVIISMFGNPTPTEDAEAEIKTHIESVVKGLRRGTWEGSGGKGTVSWAGNILIVCNVIEVHELLAGYFCL